MNAAVADPSISGLVGYLPIPVKSLMRVNVNGLNLYIPGENGEPSLYRDASLELTLPDLKRVLDRGHTDLYVRKGEYGKYQFKLRQQLEQLAADETMAPQDRFDMIQTAVAAEIQQAFHLLDAGKAVSLAQEVGGHIVQSLAGTNAVPRDLFRVMRHDFYTFTHVINVSSYCVLLAQELGISDKAELEEIAIGGLLHDIGKRKVPTEILNKKGRPTDREWEAIRAHPRTGYEDLVGRPELTFAQLMMVYQHHEKLDGTGYPVGITGDEMHPWGKLCAVVDIFDAMTAKRPYRKAMRLTDVLDYQEGIAGTHLDREMVKCWSAAMRNR